MNLLGNAGRYLRAHLLTVEIAFLESQVKRSHEENILSKISKTLLSLANAGTIPVTKYYKLLALIPFQTLITLKLLFNLRANLII